MCGSVQQRQTSMTIPAEALLVVLLVALDNTPGHKTWRWVLGEGEEPKPIAIALVPKGATTRLHPLALPIRSMAPRAVGTYGAMVMGPPGPFGSWGPLGVWGLADVSPLEVGHKLVTKTGWILLCQARCGWRSTEDALACTCCCMNVLTSFSKTPASSLHTCTMKRCQKYLETSCSVAIKKILWLSISFVLTLKKLTVSSVFSLFINHFELIMLAE